MVKKLILDKGKKIAKNVVNKFTGKNKTKPKVTSKKKTGTKKKTSGSKLTAAERKQLNSIPPAARAKIEKKIAADKAAQKTRESGRGVSKKTGTTKAAEDYLSRLQFGLKKGGRAR